MIGSIYKNKLGLEFVVIGYISAKKVRVKFLKTGYETLTQKVKITEGSVKDVMEPFLYGVGYYGCKQRELHNPKKAYSTWRHMIYRCYSPEAKKSHPTYSDCSVCDDWHSFKNFYLWHKENYIEGYHLDKDIKVKGNKIYSPETCMFVTSFKNQFESHAKKYLITHPCGKIEEATCMSEFCKKHGLTHANMSKVCSGERRHHKGFKAMVVK